MGLYKRKWRDKRGKIHTSNIWEMSYVVPGMGQKCESTKTSNKRVAQQILDARRGEIAHGKFDLLKKAPQLKDWVTQYLESVEHPNTRRRYASSGENLIEYFGPQLRLDHISARRIEEFKRTRREEGVKGATINMDLRFLALMLKQSERERYIGRSPFDLTKFFVNETRERRKPHILSWDEQEKLLAVARPRIRVLTILGVETGMRSGEMFRLKWSDIDLLNDRIQILQSKTRSGIRSVSISSLCKVEILRWRNLVGPDFSEWVFPNFENRRHPLQGGRKAWAATLKKAGIPYFPIYNLRHTFATRLTTAGVSPLTVAHMLGHSTSQIVPRYAQVLDENCMDAMKRLEALRQSVTDQVPQQSKQTEGTNGTIRQ
jgi:integrase